MASPTNSYIRDSLSDQGITPNYGALNVSPDIIPQLVAVNPSQVQQLFGTATYGQDIANQEGINIVQGQSNYIYLRAYNPTSTPATVQLSVYWASGSTVQTPSQWISQQIGFTQQITIPPNSVMVAPEPAVWSPLQLPDAGHYCLIAQITWNGFAGITNTTTFPNVNAWWQYCKNNNTLAQRNIDVVKAQPNVVQEWNLDLLNPDPSPIFYSIFAACTVPINSIVTLYCSSPDLNPPISTGPVNITVNNQNVTSASTIPANFQGTLQVIFQPPANSDDGVYTIVVTQYIATGDGKNQQLGSYTFDINIGLSNVEWKENILKRNNALYKKPL